MTSIAARAPQTALFETELIFGELLSNVVRHTPGITVVEIDFRLATPVMCVRDRGARFEPCSALPDDDLAENGRGMFLINALARHVALARTLEGGNELRITLPLTTDGALEALEMA
ncbi:MAG: hypothetical protein NVS4B5_21790 [Vulcanimicrobiaceae bacterium]